MQRQLKFRMWDNLNKHWLLGYDMPNLGGFSMFGETIIFGEYSKVFSDFKIDDWHHIKLMQFTGLTDKNGVEIYEGDILKHPKATESEHLGFVVEWNNYKWVCVCIFDKTIVVDLDDYFKQTEVIGNIHQHKHLLE